MDISSWTVGLYGVLNQYKTNSCKYGHLINAERWSPPTCCLWWEMLHTEPLQSLRSTGNTLNFTSVPLASDMCSLSDGLSIHVCMCPSMEFRAVSKWIGQWCCDMWYVTVWGTRGNCYVTHQLMKLYMSPCGSPNCGSFPCCDTCILTDLHNNLWHSISHTVISF